MDEDLDALVHRVDEDRWLASRFAPEEARTGLIAIYALNHEIARAAESVRTPAMGDIRLAWWREALAEIHDGKRPRVHPILHEYALVNHRTPFPLPVIEALLEARGRDLEQTPFATDSERRAYVDATAGNVMRLAVRACGADPGAHDALIRDAALAWGCTGLLRAEQSWSVRGRRVQAADEETTEALTVCARAAYDAVHAMAKAPAQIFPALGYVAIAPLYLKALERGKRDTPLLLRQGKLVAAVATGRI